MEDAANESSYFGWLYAEQVGLLYKNAPLAYAVTLVNGAILAFVLSEHVATPVLMTWYGALVSVTAIRAVFVRQYARVRPSPDAARWWNSVYVAGAAVAGSIWGAAAIVLFPGTAIAHQVFIAFVLAGMSAGSITVLAYRMEASLAFLFPVLLPLIFRYLTLGTPLHMAMGVMTSVFLVGMVISALNFNRAILTTLRLRLDKRELENEITRRNRAEEALLLEKTRLQAVLSSIGEGVAMVDANGSIEYLNSVAEKICGCSCYSALRRGASEVFESFDLNQHERTSTAMEDCVLSAKQITKHTVVMNEGGNKRVIEELATPLYGPNRKLMGAVSILRDVTETIKKTEQLVYAAHHDALTGLPNRNLLNSRTLQAIARAQRRHESFALLFLDLDRFKEINDTLGHAAGDALLINVARRLADTVREEDTIARLGGDEFVVLLEGPTQANQVEAIVDKIHQTLHKPYLLGTQSVTVGVSIGASLFPLDGLDPESLLVHADAGMYRAKNR